MNDSGSIDEIKKAYGKIKIMVFGLMRVTGMFFTLYQKGEAEVNAIAQKIKGQF